MSTQISRICTPRTVTTTRRDPRQIGGSVRAGQNRGLGAASDSTGLIVVVQAEPAMTALVDRRRLLREAFTTADDHPGEPGMVNELL